MDFWNWIAENIGGIWGIIAIAGGLALYLAKKSKDGQLAEVWKDVKVKLLVLAGEALQEVEPDDLYAIAGPFWDNYLADIAVLRAFGIGKDRFLAWCWAQWERFVATEEKVEVAVARRMRVGSRAFNA